jgi:hypothetical protein
MASFHFMPGIFIPTSAPTRKENVRVAAPDVAERHITGAGFKAQMAGIATSGFFTVEERLKAFQAAKKERDPS